MAWNLFIDIMDVGYGDSSLIIARDDEGNSRSMLIDGGSATSALRVHDYVKGKLDRLEIPRLDKIVVSSYNDEHYQGVAGLLVADNVSSFATTLAEVAVREGAAGIDTGRQVAGATAGAYAVCMGGYDKPFGNAVGARAWTQNLAQQARGQIKAGMTDEAALHQTWQYLDANKPAPVNGNPLLVLDPALVKEIAWAAGLAVGDAFIREGHGGSAPTLIAQQAVKPGVRKTLLEVTLHPVTPANLRFDTGDAYTTTQVIDMGPVMNSTTAYANKTRELTTAVGGDLPFPEGEQISDRPLLVPPGVARAHVENPAVGAEIFWNARPSDQVLDGVPAVFVAYAGGQVMDAEAATRRSFVPNLTGAERQSIGLVVRFNDYFHYTAADLPAAVSERVADAIVTKGMLCRLHANHDEIMPFSSVKWGDHGSSTSTSHKFLRDALPHAALITNGPALVQNPSQMVVDRLQAADSVQFFYSTYMSPIATAGKSRPCGNGTVPHGAPGRVRGDIMLLISEAQSFTLDRNTLVQLLISYLNEHEIPRTDTIIVETYTLESDEPWN
ncbi:hypothetical protein ACIBQ1_51035 [Nonomuraea sp. NPDC050153]|uniref:hypothetical protein n=1 Tax=Nonomuraea sp. NPDC050153 TaxID=3364359 RepID=UPI00378DCAEA